MKIKHLVALISIVATTLAYLQYTPIASASSNSTQSWTLMVYLDADNSLDQFGPINLQQMSEGLALGANVNVVVLMDRLNLPAYTYQVTNGEIKTIQSLGEVDMGNPETLTSFVVFAMKNFPASNYLLDLWDHGGGYIGVCWDASSGHHLSPHDVEIAVASAESQVNQRIQVIGFDACLMGMVEVAYELKDVTNIVLGSEMLIPGLGWPYTALTAYLSANPSADPYTFSSWFVSAYVAAYPKSIVQLSAEDETAFADFAVSLNSFADSLKANIATYQTVIAGARGNAQQKIILGTANVYYYADIYKFANLVGERGPDANIKAKSLDLMSKLNNAVFAQAFSAQRGNLDAKEFGLTVYFPPNAQAYSANYEKYVPLFVTQTTWQSFLMAYYSAM